MSNFILSIATLLCLCSCMKASAGIYETAAEMDLSQKESEPYKEQIRAGKMIAKSHDRGIWTDYASATVIGKPTDRQSKTVLTSAHLYLGRSYDQFVFCDDNGGMHEVEANVINLCSDTAKLTAFNDISIFHLKEPIPFQCQTEIARISQREISLKSISYGWAITKNFEQIHVNNYGQNPYLLGNDFQVDLDGCYKHNYLADRLITKQYFENVFTHRYVARDNVLPNLAPVRRDELYCYDREASCFSMCFEDIFPDFRTGLGNVIYMPYIGMDIHYISLPNLAPSHHHQLYDHDSGSSWFRRNEVDNTYTLTALSSRKTYVPEDSGNPNDPDRVLGELPVDFSESNLILKMLKLQTEMPCQDILTPLAPHRDWIYLHCL